MTSNQHSEAQGRGREQLRSTTGDAGGDTGGSGGGNTGGNTGENVSNSAGECAHWLSIVSHLFTTRMVALLAPHHLTPSQFGILTHIAHARGKTRISDIAKAVEAGQPAVTKAVTKFESLGLVAIAGDGQDKRVKYVTPTPHLAGFIDTIHQEIGPDMEQIFNQSGTDLNTLSQALRGLAIWLDGHRL